jgi:flagellar protein FlaF
MGFSYVAAVAILLSSSLIFFGMVYSDYVQSNVQINGAESQMTHQNYEYLNSNANITGYNVTTSNLTDTVTVNITNTGSITFNLNKTTVLLNGTIIQFNYSSEYLFPLESGNITFQSQPGNESLEIVYNTGYKEYVELSV